MGSSGPACDRHRRPIFRLQHLSACECPRGTPRPSFRTPAHCEPSTTAASNGEVRGKRGDILNLAGWAAETERTRLPESAWSASRGGDPSTAAGPGRRVARAAAGTSASRRASTTPVVGVPTLLPAKVGSSGITSDREMDAAGRANKTIEVGSNFFLFFSSQVDGK